MKGSMVSLGASEEGWGDERHGRERVGSYIGERGMLHTCTRLVGRAWLQQKGRRRYPKVHHDETRDESLCLNVYIRMEAKAHVRRARLCCGRATAKQWWLLQRTDGPATVGLAPCLSDRYALFEP